MTGGEKTTRGFIEDFAPLFRDCAEAALYGPHLDLDGKWTNIKLDGSVEMESIRDFAAVCDGEGWTTVLARSAEAANILVSENRNFGAGFSL